MPGSLRNGCSGPSSKVRSWPCWSTRSSGHLENGRSILVVYPGLLARYGQMGFLETLREEVNRARRLKSCWLLLPGDNQALIDGQAVPLIGPGQKTRIPESWLQNVHRGG